MEPEQWWWRLEEGNRSGKSFGSRNEPIRTFDEMAGGGREQGSMLLEL